MYVREANGQWASIHDTDYAKRKHTTTEYDDQMLQLMKKFQEATGGHSPNDCVIENMQIVGLQH